MTGPHFFNTLFGPAVRSLQTLPFRFVLGGFAISASRLDARIKHSMNWHDITDPRDTELDRLAALYNLHPLHIEDCRNGNQRAKIEENNGYIFCVLKLVAVLPDGELSIWDLDTFLGPGWVITVQEGNETVAANILRPVHAMADNLRPDEIFYRVGDAVVDSYLPILDGIDDQIDQMEEQVLSDPTPEVLARIFRAKRNLIELRRIFVNTRDVAAHLYRTEHTLIAKDLMPFLRDIYDHVARNLDLVETQRDLLSGTMDVYLSSVANRTNQVMKVLTILGTIALPSLVISGFFGMNVGGVPFLATLHGAQIVTAMMVIATLLLLALLRKYRWL